MIADTKKEEVEEGEIVEEEEIPREPLPPQSFPKINKNSNQEILEPSNIPKPIPDLEPQDFHEEVLVDNRPIRPAKNKEFPNEELPDQQQEKPEEKREVKKKPFLKRKKVYDPKDAIKKSQPERPKTPK